MSDDFDRLARGVIAVGFDGTTLGANLAKTFASSGFAGYVLFARNCETLEQTRALTDALRALHDVAPIIAVDQEGGRVARVQDHVERFPPMMALGATRDAALAERAGEQIAFDLRRAGANVDLAPVLDIAVDARNTVIGTRSFGADPESVTTLAGSFARGLERGGIVATFKHFPGHGSTSIDSHLAIPLIDVDEATLRDRDFLPFAQLASEARAFMSAHVVVSALDRSNPSTLSHKVLTDFLRGSLHFQGVCFTDCMQMDAMTTGVGTIEGVAAAIGAGADCALVSHDPELALRAAEHLAQAVRDGCVSYERLREAYARVDRLRRSLQGPRALDETPPHPGVGREIGRRAVTLVRGVPHADPTAGIIISFESETVEGAQGVHAQHASLAAQAPALESMTLPLEPSPAQVEAVLGTLGVAGRRAIVLARRAHIYRSQALAIRAIIEREPDAIVVSLREPFDVALFPAARHVLATYGDDAPSIAGLADVLFGGSEPTGTLPVHLTAPVSSK